MSRDGVGDVTLRRLRPDAQREKLVDLVPYTADGVAGCRIIIKEENADAWLSDPGKLRELLDLGYVRVVKEPHRYTQAFGDYRRGRPR